MSAKVTFVLLAVSAATLATAGSFSGSGSAPITLPPSGSGSGLPPTPSSGSGSTVPPPPADPWFPPYNSAPRCQQPGIQNLTLYYAMLEASTQMPAQVGALRVGVPFDHLVAFFNKPLLWPLWNHLFKSNNVTSYNLCDPFDAVAYTNAPPVQPPFPANMSAPHYIDQHGFTDGGNTFAFGWIFQLINPDGSQLVFGRHTFTLRRYVDQSGVESTVVESFEKAAGPQMDSHHNKVAWTIALQESLMDGVRGFQCLELVFLRYKQLTTATVRQACRRK